MDSEQVEKRYQGNVIQSHRPERIDTSGGMLPSNSHEGVRTQPQLLTDQDFDAINKRLLAAGEAIEISRQNLFETRFIASSALQELKQERQIRRRCSDAYKELHIQYGKRVGEMHETTIKCLSLHKELEQSQNTISNYESIERGITAEKLQLEDEVKDLERKGADTAQQIQIVLDRETWARKRIEELENEISKRVARECLAEQRIDELQKEMEELIQGQGAMSITVDHVNPADKNDDEFRDNYGIYEPPKMVSIGSSPPEGSPSLGAMKRERSAKNGVNPLPQVRPSKYRKCKEAAKAAEEDTVVV